MRTFWKLIYIYADIHFYEHSLPLQSLPISLAGVFGSFRRLLFIDIECVYNPELGWSSKFCNIPCGLGYTFGFFFLPPQSLLTIHTASSRDTVIVDYLSGCYFTENIWNDTQTIERRILCITIDAEWNGLLISLLACLPISSGSVTSFNYKMAQFHQFWWPS